MPIGPAAPLRLDHAPDKGAATCAVDSCDSAHDVYFLATNSISLSLGTFRHSREGV